jgi:hypothetical protein
LRPVPATGSIDQPFAAPPLLPSTQATGKTASLPTARGELSTATAPGTRLIDNQVQPARYDAPRSDQGWQ